MERQDISPFRMQVLMGVAAKVVKIMVTGAWHLTFEEMDMVLALVKSGMEESRKRNGTEKGNSEETEEESKSKEEREMKYVLKVGKTERDYEK